MERKRTIFSSVLNSVLYLFAALICLLIFALIINRCINFGRFNFFSQVNEKPKTKILIKTNFGWIQGLIKEKIHKKIGVFLGVPFSKPMVNELRFRKPQADHSPSRVYDATNAKAACLQWKSNESFGKWPKSEILPDFSSVNESEDCLYLNIYTPLKSMKTAKTVMVWIHGGAFLRGFINFDLYDGSTLSAFGNVVVVLVSYRLGIMGFMSAGKDELSGNMGLHDQVLALKWIQSNIASFGGDPQNVVLFGQGSGAISIGYHLISPLSNTLFQRAIMESGGPLSPIFLLGSGSGPYKVQKVAEKCKCNVSRKKSALIPVFDNRTVSCLQKVNADVLMKIQNELIKKHVDSVFFPVEDGNFLKQHPFDAVKSGNFGIQKEVLMGSNSNDGAIFLLLLLPNLFLNFKKPNNLTLDKLNKELQKLGPKKAKQYYSHLTKTVFSTVNVSNSDALLQEMQRLALDVFFTCPDVMFIDAFTKAGKKVYYYKLKHRSSRNPWPEWLEGGLHFEEIQYVFGRPLDDPYKYKSSELQLSIDLMTNWIEFAKNGRPKKKWKPCSEKSKSIAVFDDDEIKYANNLPENKCYTLYEEFFTVARSILRYYDE